MKLKLKKTVNKFIFDFWVYIDIPNYECKVHPLSGEPDMVGIITDDFSKITLGTMIDIPKSYLKEGELGKSISWIPIPPDYQRRLKFEFEEGSNIANNVQTGLEKEIELESIKPEGYEDLYDEYLTDCGAYKQDICGECREDSEYTKWLETKLIEYRKNTVIKK